MRRLPFPDALSSSPELTLAKDTDGLLIFPIRGVVVVLAEEAEITASCVVEVVVEVEIEVRRRLSSIGRSSKRCSSFSLVTFLRATEPITTVQHDVEVNSWSPFWRKEKKYVITDFWRIIFSHVFNIQLKCEELLENDKLNLNFSPQQQQTDDYNEAIRSVVYAWQN